MHAKRAYRPGGRGIHGGVKILLALLLAMCLETDAQTAGYRVIVNPANPTTEVDRTFLARAFLKKLSRWPDGALIRPVDLDVDSPARHHFSDDILGRSVAAIRNAWQQAIFAGRDVPPPELDSDAAVVDYVLKYPGAVGYVSPETNLRGTRVLQVH